MFLGTLGGLAISVLAITLPYQTDLVAEFPPELLLGISPGISMTLLVGAFIKIRGTFALSVTAMFGSLAGAVGALFSDHIVYSPIFLLWAVLFFVGQYVAFHRNLRRDAL
ncbi:hypothetical protein AGRA3207_005233 [Actinomadura graeca]|uniref:Uncharacterized protein n=1 Tax=Actinomadura graeca TaxID=2750812 RepID=A0ABX8QYZ1_9ACTN|nr:hypothetical protein [Actinomadura graeca]QXJ23990.1 hypothetical protein AGRA3207_005233 [Actinomadura graeca]